MLLVCFLLNCSCILSSFFSYSAVGAIYIAEFEDCEMVFQVSGYF